MGSSGKHTILPLRAFRDGTSHRYDIRVFITEATNMFANSERSSCQQKSGGARF